MRRAILTISCGLAMLMPMVGRAQDTIMPVTLFDLENVRLLDGPFKVAQNANADYILAHDPDRLLAPFRREAGLPKKAEPYGNWESMGLDGHTAGHYLSALAMMYAGTGDERFKDRLDYMVTELAEVQKANGNGYVGGVPRSKELWTDVAAGQLEGQSFGLGGRWVPWYNLHKTYAGLRDAYLICKNEQAKDVLIGMADWCSALLDQLTDEQVQTMLRAEHGGMNEVLADVYAITGDEKYLTAARRFCDHRILDPLIAGRDDLTGKHANTQIPKAIGFQRIAALGGDDELHRAARFFWDTVTTRRSVAIGGNSVGEHFHPVDNFRPMIEDRTGPETCNTYNMLRLSEALFQAGPEARIADFHERALYNHILSTQHPTRGGFVYFTPMRPRHYRVYSTAEQCFWCCVGTGFENHARYGQFIYAHDDEALYANLFIASELTWDEKGLTLRQETRFPDESSTRLALSLQQPATFAIKIRRPHWLAAEDLAVTVNGETVAASTDASGYAVIRREWQDGDVIDISLPMNVQAERLPDGSDYVALRYGPVVLAAVTGTEDLEGLFAGSGRMAHTAEGPLRPIATAPTLVIEDVDRIADHIARESSEGLSFTIDNLVQPAQDQPLRLIPFFRLHEARYELYWPIATPAEYAQRREQFQAEERLRLALEAATFDQVLPGAQQSEVEHKFKGERTNSGQFRDRSWRDARGWFSYELTVPANQQADLMVGFYGNDAGRHFDILVDDEKLAEIELDGQGGDNFLTRRFPLPQSSTDRTITVRFEARPGSIAGGVFGVRIVDRNFESK